MSFPIPALHTGQICLFGLVSNHVCRHGQQNRCPHIEITASLATSKQILHSKAALVFESSVASLLFSLLFAAAAPPSLFLSSLSDALDTLGLRLSFSLILGLAPPLSSFLLTFSFIWLFQKILNFRFVKRLSHITRTP